MEMLKNNKLVTFLIIVVMLGICFRVTHLDQKPYWLDETYTLLRSSGYTAQQATQNLFNGQVIEAEDVLRYQHPSVGDGGAWGTITGLATEEPHHPPLFFLLARGWAQCLGHSKLTLRSLPVMGSVLVFPAVYWLCLELFASPLVGLLAMALVAVSPIQVRYAQEVRQYSLWLAIILLSCVVFLRAIRQPTKLNWGIYTLTITLGFYCHLITGLVVTAHGIYILLRERLRLTQAVVGYLVAAMVGGAIALPWFWVLWKNRSVATQALEHFTHPLPFWSLLQFWCISLSRLLVAWHFQYNSLLIYVTIPLLGLILYAFHFLCRHVSWKTWIFVVILLGSIILPFLIPDLLWGGRRSTAERYFLVCSVSIDVVIAYLLAAKLTQPLHSVFQQWLWRSLTAIILSWGVVSCLLGVLSPTWWGWSEFDVKIAQITNATPHPLIVSDAPFYAIVPFCHEVKPETKLILLQETALLQIPDGFSYVFLYNPGDRLLSTLKQQGSESELVYQFIDPMSKLVVSLYQIKSFERKQIASL